MKKYSLINQDYRFVTHSGTTKSLPFQKRHALLVGSLLLIALAVIIALPHDASATRSEPLSATEPASVSVSTPVIDSNPSTPGSLTEAQPTQTSNPETKISTESKWTPLTVVRGDNLETLLNRAGLSAGQANELASLNGTTKKLTKLFPGDVVNIRSTEGLITHLTFETSETEQLEISRHSDGKLSATVVTLPTETRISYATATVDNSLFLAAQNAGLSDKLILDLANIFAWDIDFALDIRPGDQFTIAYETIYRDGKKLRDGTIVAAEFTNNGATYTAIQFNSSSGGAPQYYSPNGVSLRKSFLRAPVEFTRISSKFGSSRYHPILNRIRAHKGVDYAAATGTPIRATSDGKIEFIGNKSGYGKTVVIQHVGRHSTLYAHLSGFAKNAKEGRKIRQGEIIGYVGQTGLATGPHLHYEFLVNGSHKDPLTVKLPSAPSLSKRLLSAFEKRTGELLAQLESYKQTKLALNTPNP